MAAAKPALALAIMLVSVEAAAKPNILLLFPDQWRFDWDTLHSNLSLPLRMPFLQSIIQNGTRFTYAYSPAPVCAPARASIASGREYDNAGVACNFCNDYNTSIPTFYRLLRDQGGYHVMVTGKDDLTKFYRLHSQGQTVVVTLTNWAFPTVSWINDARVASTSAVDLRLP
eukprot:TRINITY_DN11228_c0_g1_i12.p2 TRINITY_DN11228_c0_g1~~TRINITY_DN11228_c0_g1_i12.p2  ORF type:complete len:171 (+),score=10.52 TRINITY_DN11228_c0_g1_i12:2-514(+)